MSTFNSRNISKNQGASTNQIKLASVLGMSAEIDAELGGVQVAPETELTMAYEHK
eukprot:CAMPEP_0116916526 /NCGR_PEP_ID=MMETSP0467-20121206/18586_1 /TAXON_ID=283647 /ORGANISM="Mesodinium pulex, Strain SPMC105" /LENGTH=54 /DNA_ID=CAMNT_0004593417 /DNA_START=990 /DNA_END=1154 /DNA_ORIENTATION=-